MTAAEPDRAPILTPRPDGLAEGVRPVLLPIMAPRLQGVAHPDGWIDLALWGAGDLGRVRFSRLGGPYVYGPNRVIGLDGGLHVAQSAPVLVVQGARFSGLYPARRCAAWHRNLEPRPPISRAGEQRLAGLGWGAIITEQRGPDLVIAVGADIAEVEAALRLDARAIIDECAAHLARCDRLPEADPILRGMVLQGVHAALSSIRTGRDGQYAGLAAGLAYSTPARTYYRDGYWTSQALLDLEPAAARAQIDILASGIQADGEAPARRGSIFGRATGGAITSTARCSSC